MKYTKLAFHGHTKKTKSIKQQQKNTYRNCKFSFLILPNSTSNNWIRSMMKT